jgi:hypothetical protein
VPAFFLLGLEEVLSCTLDSESSISDVNAMLSESLSEFSIEVIADLRLRRRLLVYPETDLIRELLIVEASGKQGLFNELKLDLLSPLVRLEVAVNLISRYV